MMPPVTRHTDHLVWMVLSGLVLWSVPAQAQDGPLRPPKLTRFVAATLPADAPDRAGLVRLMITLDNTGAVTEVTVEVGLGEPWDSAAKVAAERFGFEPAHQGRVAIPVKVPFNYRFRRRARRRGRFVAQRMRRRPLQPAPGYRLGGVVLEKGTRAPLAGIAVGVRDPATQKAWEVVSGEGGRWTFYGLPPGPLELVVVTGEHAPLKRAVKGRPGKPDQPVDASQTLYLDPVGFSQYRTVIKDKPKPRSATEISLTDEELTQVPGTLGDPTRVVQTLPGVARSPFGLGYYVVRGASFENTGFFIDGHPALFLYHLLGGPGVIQPELVGNLTFYPGGYPAEFGRYATGAIVLETKNPPDDRWHGDISIDLLKASVLFSLPFDDNKGMVTASFRRSYYDLFLPLIVDGFDLSFTDYMLRLTYDPTPRLALKLIVFGAEDAVSQASDPDAGEGDAQIGSIGLGFHRINASADWRFAKGWTWKNSLVWEFDHNDAQRAAEGDKDINVGLAGWFLSLKDAIRYEPNDDFSLEAGFDGLFIQVNADLEIPGGAALGDPRPPEFDPVILNYRIDDATQSMAPYVLANWKVGGGVRVLPGFRVPIDLYGDGVEVGVDPRLAVRWQLDPRWTLTVMGAMVNQIPPNFQSSKEFGDPSLPQQRGAQGSVGVELALDQGWEFKVEGFYNHIFNMPRPSDAVQVDSDGVGRALWKADMQGRAYGAEVMIRKRIGGRFYGWLSYTISRAERLRPPDGWGLFELDQTHILNLAFQVKLGADWSVGGRFTLTSGNPYYPVTGSYFDADRDRYQPIYATEIDRLRLYHRLDLRIDKRWRMDTWILEGFLDIQNAYNAQNPESKRYSYDFSIQSDGLSFPILPTLGLRAIF